MYLRRASPSDLDAVRADPAGVYDFVLPEDEAATPPDTVVEFDKAWHGLHHALTGEAYGAGHPLGIIADEAAEAHDLDPDGFSKFWILPPERMRLFAEALADISDADIVARIDPAGMLEAEVYLADVFADDIDNATDYLMQGVPALRRFAELCSTHGEGVVRIIA